MVMALAGNKADLLDEKKVAAEASILLFTALNLVTKCISAPVWPSLKPNNLLSVYMPKLLKYGLH